MKQSIDPARNVLHQKEALCLFGVASKPIKECSLIKLWIMRIYFLLCCVGVVGPAFLMTLFIMRGAAIPTAALVFLVGTVFLLIFAAYSMYNVRLYGYCIPFLIYFATLLATALGAIENANIDRDILSFIISALGTWAAWSVLEEISKSRTSGQFTAPPAR